MDINHKLETSIQVQWESIKISMTTIVLMTITRIIINSDDYSGGVVADQPDLGTESQFPTMSVMEN